MNQQEKNVLSCIWSMFSTNFRYNTTKTEKYVEELPLSFPQRKTELKNSYWLFFIAAFVQADGQKITRSFWVTLQYLSLYSTFWV